MQLLALDIALLPPPEVRQRAIELNATLAATAVQELQLDEDHQPHITLAQLFIRAEELYAVLERVNQVVRSLRPMVVDVTGGGHHAGTIVMEIGRTPRLLELHEQLMESLRGYERPGGTRAAFVDADGRVGDVMWVTSYRLKSALHAYAPHVTLGHGDQVPAIEPFSFEADTVAAYHLGRMCTCRRVLRSWELTKPE